MLARTACYRDSGRVAPPSAACDANADACASDELETLATGVQGEIEGYRCKVEGFRHALEELEMQVCRVFNV